MKTRVHVFITGIVQGVFFRLQTANKADKIGIVGWIKNLQDGRVEAVFEGEKEAIEEIISFCKRGPPRALVKNIEVQRETYSGEYKDFTIT